MSNDKTVKITRPIIVSNSFDLTEVTQTPTNCWTVQAIFNLGQRVSIYNKIKQRSRKSLHLRTSTRECLLDIRLMNKLSIKLWLSVDGRSKHNPWIICVLKWISEHGHSKLKRSYSTGTSCLLASTRSGTPSSTSLLIIFSGGDKSEIIDSTTGRGVFLSSVTQCYSNTFSFLLCYW